MDVNRAGDDEIFFTGYRIATLLFSRGMLTPEAKEALRNSLSWGLYVQRVHSIYITGEPDERQLTELYTAGRVLIDVILGEPFYPNGDFTLTIHRDDHAVVDAVFRVCWIMTRRSQRGSQSGLYQKKPFHKVLACSGVFSCEVPGCDFIARSDVHRRPKPRKSSKPFGMDGFFPEKVTADKGYRVESTQLSHFQRNPVLCPIHDQGSAGKSMSVLHIKCDCKLRYDFLYADNPSDHLVVTHYGDHLHKKPLQLRFNLIQKDVIRNFVALNKNLHAEVLRLPSEDITHYTHPLSGKTITCLADVLPRCRYPHYARHIVNKVRKELEFHLLLEAPIDVPPNHSNKVMLPYPFFLYITIPRG